jgi:DNA invertase Pin-like site-specific DNA recombinase
VELEGHLHNLPAPLSRALAAWQKQRLKPRPKLLPRPPRLPKLAPALDEEATARAACAYLGGATASEIGAGHGVSRKPVERALKKAGVQLRLQPLSEEEIAETVRLYQSGLSILEVAEQTGRSRGSVQRYLHQAGVEVRPRAKPLKLSSLQQERVCEDYRAGLSMAAIAGRFGVGVETVRRVLQREGVPPRPAAGAS